MIELTQTENYLIGSIEAVKELSQKKSARVLCLSDSHGNQDIFKNIIEKLGSNCDALIFSGDGTSDLAGIITQAKNNEELKKAIPPVIAFAQGNCDPSSFPILNDDFKSFYDENKNQLAIPQRQILTVAGTRIMIVHGNNQSVDWGMEKLAQETQFSECKVAVYGHTHIAKQVHFMDYLFINPGSCSRPRGGLPPSCAILTITQDFIDTAFLKLDRTGEVTVFTPIA